MVKEYELALKGEWIAKEEIEKLTDPLEKLLTKKLKLAYQIGKGTFSHRHRSFRLDYHEN